MCRGCQELAADLRLSGGVLENFAQAAQESGEKNQEHLAAELQSSKLALAELTAGT